MGPSATTMPVDEDELVESVDALDPRAAASSVACARRFAIQWAMGPSAAFEPEYLQTMLHGNLANAMVKEGLGKTFAAQLTANDLWAHLTEGQRRSSLEKAVIKPSGKSADFAWLFTLTGSRHGRKPLDAAYQHAMEMIPPDEDQIAPLDAEFLPQGTTDADVCARCPVQARCAQRREPAR